MLNSGTFIGRISSLPQYANGSYNCQNSTDMFFTIACQRNPKPSGEQSQKIDTIPSVCRDYMAQKVIQLQQNSLVSVSGRVETGTDMNNPYMVLDVREINVL